MDDAFGRMLLNAIDGGGSGHEIIERDDGFVAAATIDYFAPFRHWPSVERRSVRYLRGPVLDVGCGAGRLALELQARGRKAVAIDPSPGAVEVCSRRGVDDVRQIRLQDVDASLGTFEAAAFFGNNFGVFGNRTSCRRLLRQLRPQITTIVATSNDTSATDDPVHVAYRTRNIRRGRMPGQLRVRVRFRELVDPWFDYLLVSPSEMEALVGGTGWSIDRLIRDESTYYAAVLR